MLELKLSEGSENIFTDLLKQMIQENPILLQNMVEPCINELICDADIPNKVNTYVSDSVQNYFDENPLGELIKSKFEECIVEAFTEHYGANYVSRMVSEWLSEQNIEIAFDSYSYFEEENVKEQSSMLSNKKLFVLEDNTFRVPLYTELNPTVVFLKDDEIVAKIGRAHV